MDMKNTGATTLDPIMEAVADWEAAEDDLHAAHFSARVHGGYRHGFNSVTVTAARRESDKAYRTLAAELADGRSFIVGVER